MEAWLIHVCGLFIWGLCLCLLRQDVEIDDVWKKEKKTEKREGGKIPMVSKTRKPAGGELASLNYQEC